MAATVITVTIAEADLKDVVKAVTSRAGLPNETQYAKPALVALLTEWVETERRAVIVAAQNNPAVPAPTIT